VSRDFIVIIGAIVICVTWFMFRVLMPKKTLDEPGPHNNWRKSTNTIMHSGWTENGGGLGGSDGGGSGGDGGGSD
jgi:uncharacterized membrane protein YgcG